jgi:hypothetical protein
MIAEPITESRMLVALASTFRWTKNLVIPRCCGLGQFERDLVVVTPAGYMTEVEVKLSLSDWKRDAEKTQRRWDYEPMREVRTTKFHDVEHGGRHRRFFYCVPLRLWETAQAKLTTEHLPAWAGVLTAERRAPDSKELWIREARPATQLGGRKLTDEECEGLRSTFYWRFWRHCSGAPETVDAVGVEVPT